MPELPEVECIRRQLAPLVCRRRIASLQTTGPSYFFLTSPRTLQKKLAGRSVLSISRRGKYLLAEMDDESRLLMHLGMTGQLRVAQPSEVAMLDSHVHLRVRFEDGNTELWFRDPRKFGKVRWLPAHTSDSRLDKLGIDALGCTGDHLFRRLNKRRVPIKSALMQQDVVAGVGNIYADEALFLAKIAPLRMARRLTLAEFNRLADALTEVLTTGIACGGSSIRDFMHPSGKRGSYQSQHWCTAAKAKRASAAQHRSAASYSANAQAITALIVKPKHDHSTKQETDYYHALEVCAAGCKGRPLASRYCTPLVSVISPM